MRYGIDLGGTKTEIIALDPLGRECLRERVSTPAQSYDGILSTIVNLVEAFDAKLGIRGNIGIGIPGAISPASGNVKNANTVCLIGKPLDKHLEERLGRPVVLANDANCFALSEATDGAAAGADVVFGVILGTGVGGGIIVHRKVIGGANSIAGEWGHNPLPWPTPAELPGPACYCGKSGCIETFLSGPGLTNDHANSTGFQELLPPEILARSANGDADCESTLQRYEERLAKALATVVNIIDPDVIVLGGGLSNMARIYENVPKLWGKYVFSDRVDTELLPAKFGDSSGVRGAAWL